jgi:hypothetical protein
MGFGALSFVRYSKEYKRTQHFRNWICFCPRVRGWETPDVLGPYKELTLITELMDLTQ